MKKTLIIFMLMAFLVFSVWFALTQTKPKITKTAQVTLSVKPAPTFTLEVNPAHIDSSIERTVAYSATVTSINNFAGDVVFSVSGLPVGFTVTMFPGNTITLGPDAPKGIQININIGSNPLLVGDYTITVTAESTNYN